MVTYFCGHRFRCNAGMFVKLLAIFNPNLIFLGCQVEEKTEIPCRMCLPFVYSDGSAKIFYLSKVKNTTV